MKKTIILMITILLIISGLPVSAEPEKAVPETASAAVIMAQEGTGRIIFEKNADQRVYPASTTKVMTAMIAIEKLDPSQVLVASETAIQIDRDGSNMGILAGEELTVEQLLYGLLVHSANDAANVLAEAVSGDIPSFVNLMNEKAKELGMNNSHFMNAHGYHDPDHYTTARDMLTLSMKAMESDLFCKIVSTPVYEIPPTNRYTEIRYLSSNNALINVMKGHKYIYDGAKGIKTGHTNDAGYCLTSYAERNGLGFFCVTMNAPVDYTGNYSFLDTISLFDYGYKTYALKNVADVNEIVATHDVKWAKDGEQVVLTAKEPLEVMLPKNHKADLLTTQITVEENITAPVKQGSVLGRVDYYYDGEMVGSMDLIATRDIDRSNMTMIFKSLWNIIFSAWVMVPLTLVVVVLILRSVREERKKRIARERRRQQFRKELDR
ncbi:MAG: D-alanyl-D-alanine carboxypeptidase [Clostridia bacterium]|nr:D-alanyl-D-alanine carboxypeptidase [Clostridia bacterium]